MKEIVQLLNDMVKEGITTNHALFGALAQARYTEPVATLHADVLVAVSQHDRIDVLAPLYEFSRQKGYMPEAEGMRVGDWPLQLRVGERDASRDRRPGLPARLAECM